MLRLFLYHYCSVAQSCLTLCDPMDCSRPGFPVHHQLPELSRPHVIDPVMPFSHLILCRPLLLLLQSFLASGSFPVSWLSYQVAKVWELQFQHQSFQWIFKVDFFRIDWFDLLAVQRTLNSLLQLHSSKASVLWHSTFLMVQLSHL